MISVVICTYNRSQSLRESLASLARMEVPADLSWELIVIDNNSTDDTRAVVDQFSQNSNLQVRYIFEGKQGLSHARNAGVAEAGGEIIAFLDDDVIVTEVWLTEVNTAFKKYSPLCMGGKVGVKVDLVRPSWWGEWSESALGKFDQGDAVIIGDASYIGQIGMGANLSFRRSAFEKYGLFRPDLGRIGTRLLMGEEVELVERMRRAGELTIYYPKALIYHCPSVGRLSKQYMRRWYYRGGQWQHSWDLCHDAKAKKILGFHRWRIRSGGEDLAKALLLNIIGKPDKAFRHEIGFISFLGYLGEFLKTRFHRSAVKT